MQPRHSFRSIMLDLTASPEVPEFRRKMIAMKRGLNEEDVARI